MVRIFNHYFRQRSILQAMVYMVLIVSTLVISMAWQVGAEALKDALNNSFPGVLRLGYFSDGANLS